jgi:hypothetical protein
MSKKKSVKKQPLLSPENYIRQKARNLTIAECLITPKWEEAGECNILVARKHSNGNYTIGIYLIDTYCLGVKDTGYRFNMDQYEYEELKAGFGNDLEPATYEEAHNIIYGALTYAEELGFRPNMDFGVARYILEEDTDDIPLIEYEFGCDGKPRLVVNTRAELNRYLPTLKKAVGDDYTVFVYDGDGDNAELNENGNETTSKIAELFEGFSDDEREAFLDRMEDMMKNIEKSQSLPHTTYNYQHPDYLQTLDLTHKELGILFFPEYNEKLEKKDIDKILSFPRETLIKDLENSILYEIGQNCNGISKRNEDNNSYGLFVHAIRLLAELKSTESLPVVLEIMRQNEEFFGFFFGDSATDILVPVLYQLAKNQLPVLLSFAKEPGLYPFFKIIISPVVEMVVDNESERRAEVIAWYGELLDFLYEKIEDTAYYDANFTGMLMHELMNISAKELLPEIKRLYDTGLVDKMCCGDYDVVEKEISAGVGRTGSFKVKSIYEYYK